MSITVYINWQWGSLINVAKPPCIAHIFEAPPKHSPIILFKSEFKDCTTLLARLNKNSALVRLASKNPTKISFLFFCGHN